MSAAAPWMRALTTRRLAGHCPASLSGLAARSIAAACSASLMPIRPLCPGEQVMLPVRPLAVRHPGGCLVGAQGGGDLRPAGPGAQREVDLEGRLVGAGQVLRGGQQLQMLGGTQRLGVVRAVPFRVVLSASLERRVGAGQVVPHAQLVVPLAGRMPARTVTPGSIVHGDRRGELPGSRRRASCCRTRRSPGTVPQIAAPLRVVVGSGHPVAGMPFRAARRAVTRLVPGDPG